MIVSPTIVLIDPTADLQAAIDDAPDYATIRLAPGIYTAPDAGGFVIDHPITIEGSGNEYIYDSLLYSTPKVLGTVLRPYNAGVTADGAKDSTVITLTVTGDRLSHVVLKNFSIENPYGQPAVGTGDGPRTARSGYTTLCRVENVSVYFMGRDGFHAEGVSLGDSYDQSTISRCQFAGCARHGAYLNFCTDDYIDECTFVGNLQCGLVIYQSSGIHQEHCLYNGNGSSFVADGSNDWFGTASNWPYYHQAQCYVQSSSRITINRCDFEVWNLKNVPHAIGVEGMDGGCITNCECFNASYSAAAVEKTFIMLASDARAVLISGNQVSQSDNWLYVRGQAGNLGNTILPAACTRFDPVLDTAPNKLVLNDNLDTDSSGTPTGGNLVMLPLETSASSLYKGNFAAGLKLPVISAASAFSAQKYDGTLACAADEKAMKIYQDGSWQTVAAGLVSIDGDIVTYDDDPVSY